MMEEPLLRIEGMDVGYQGKRVISEITLAIHPGEIVTLIGPNGTGKSTILKTIVQQLAPLQGRIRMLGQDIGSIPARRLAQQVSMVLTSRIHPELMTCYDVVAMGRYPYTGYMGGMSAQDKQQVEEAMELVNIKDFAMQPFMEVSDGQRQRVMLAKAICQEPVLLVLDEPTSFLDIRYKLELMSILSALSRQKQVAILMSLHELNLAKRISDTIVCVKDGKISGIGTPEEMMQPDKIETLFELPPGESEIFV